MDLQKFGIKLFFQPNGSDPSRDFIPELHRWIQNDSIPEHMLIDVVDYSHIPDGPGVMLIAHEGHFSLDKENNKHGIMYMRKTDLEGSFIDRFNKVLSIVINAAKLLRNNNIDKELDFYSDSFRFIANDRRMAVNTLKNQNLFQTEINHALEDKFLGSKWNYEAVSMKNERLAFTIHFDNEVDIIDKN